jgi:RimJ/RimL family protein N-acetyltransferase
MKITQRTATLNDAEILLNWRNDPNIRKFSRQPEQISGEEHLDWLRARLEKVQLEPYYLFVQGSRAIGMSRLDAVSDSLQRFEISIMVDPNQHGKGIGTSILNVTCKSFFLLHPEKSIVAHISRHNFISQKLFISAGFKLQTSFGDFLRFEKSLD